MSFFSGVDRLDFEEGVVIVVGDFNVEVPDRPWSAMAGCGGNAVRENVISLRRADECTVSDKRG
jgi:hypothetical protein